MKKIITTVMLIGLIKFLCGCGNSTFFMGYGYNVRGEKVFYKNAFPGSTIEIAGADGNTFKVLIQPGDSLNNSNTEFAIDKNFAYWGGGPIEGSDGPSFKIIDRYFSKDKGQCYYRGKLIPGADPASFTVKDETFSLDKNGVYKGTFRIDDDASIFEGFDSSFVVRTAHAVSVYDSIVDLPAGATFTYLKYNYFAINGQVYFQGAAIPGVTEKGFKAIDNWFYATPTHVYYRDKEITGADPHTYELFNDPYGRDAKHVFFFEKMIEDADPKTFRVLNTKFQCARDKQGAWYANVRIKNVTAEDMVNQKECIQCNETKIYFSEQ